MTRKLSPRSFHRWMKYFQLKDEDDWERREKWEYYAADILQMLYTIYRRVDGLLGPTRIPVKTRKDFLMDRKIKRERKKTVPVKAKEIKPKKLTKAEKAKRDLEADKRDLQYWSIFLGDPSFEKGLG